MILKNVQFNRRESTSSTSSGESGTPIDGIEGEYFTDVIQNKSFTVCLAYYFISLLCMKIIFINDDDFNCIKI